MSDDVTYRSVILKDGMYAIGQVLAQKKKLRPHSFQVGDKYNFIPSEDAYAISGNLVYTGRESQIVSSVITKDTTRFSLTFLEEGGDYNIGNVILYVQTDDGVVLPFILVVMKIPYPKSGIQGEGSIGNRYVFNFFQRLINANDILTMNIVPGPYFSLAGFRSEKDLPLAENISFQEFIIQEPSFSPVPIMGMRRAADNQYYGQGLYSRLDEPFFGVLDGGRAQEGRRPYPGGWFWGGTLSMEDSSYSYVFGATLDEEPIFTVGGETL